MRSFQLLFHRRRHPLLRALSLVLALFLVGLMVVFGLVAAGVLMVGGAIWLALRQWRHAGAPKRAPRGQGEVLEGEFVVLRERRPMVH